MKSKAIIPLILGLAVGLATVKLAVNTIRKAQAGSRSVTMVTTVRARLDIDAFKEITPDMVELIETPENAFVPEGDRVENLEDVIGRVSGKGIPQHSPVLLSMLAPEGTAAGMVGRIPVGFRAVSVRIDEVTGVAFQINPGDWVDVIVVMDVARLRGGGRDTVAEVILQKVRVAAIGYSTSAVARPGVGKIKPAKSATLLVAEQDVPKLHLASTRGKITLSMRGHEEGTSKHPATASLRDVVSALREPTRVPYGQGDTPPTRNEPQEALPHEVVVYHAAGRARDPSTIERITFEHERSSKIVSVSEGHPSRAASVMRQAVGERSRRGRHNFGGDDADEE